VATEHPRCAWLASFSRSGAKSSPVSSLSIATVASASWLASSRFAAESAVALDAHHLGQDVVDPAPVGAQLRAGLPVVPEQGHQQPDMRTGVLLQTEHDFPRKATSKDDPDNETSKARTDPSAGRPLLDHPKG